MAQSQESTHFADLQSLQFCLIVLFAYDVESEPDQRLRNHLDGSFIDSADPLDTDETVLRSIRKAERDLLCNHLHWSVID